MNHHALAVGKKKVQYINVVFCHHFGLTVQESLHWNLTLGEKSLAAPGNRTCVGNVPVQCFTNWAICIPSFPFPVGAGGSKEKARQLNPKVCYKSQGLQGDERFKQTRVSQSVSPYNLWTHNGKKNGVQRCGRRGFIPRGRNRSFHRKHH